MQSRARKAPGRRDSCVYLFTCLAVSLSLPEDLRRQEWRFSFFTHQRKFDLQLKLTVVFSRQHAGTRGQEGRGDPGARPLRKNMGGTQDLSRKMQPWAVSLGGSGSWVCTVQGAGKQKVKCGDGGKGTHKPRHRLTRIQTHKQDGWGQGPA